MIKELKIEDRRFSNNSIEKRSAQRYAVQTRVSLAVEDEQMGEAVGLGIAGDVSAGGVRLRNLPPEAEVRVGDQLKLLLISEERMLSLRGEVVHHSLQEDFGVKFLDVSRRERQLLEDFLQKLFVH